MPSAPRPLPDQSLRLPRPLSPAGAQTGDGWPATRSYRAAQMEAAPKLYASGLQAALNRRPKVRLRSVPLKLARPRPVSLRISGRQKLDVRSFHFHSPAGGDAPPAPVAAPTGRASRQVPLKLRSGDTPPAGTRMRAPQDVIKLQDRLFYLLQPPLETLVASGELGFPFQPFPYQYEGVAFLYPRVAAILADEMGLGKTMQTITTIRLLLLRGELRRVLLVCPKPLVTNWVREFKLWAPEIPLSIVEGRQPQRRWLWRQAPTPVLIANYELLRSDREIVTDSRVSFDLVALDEAQRIKNPASAISDVVRQLQRSRSWALTGTPIENSVNDLLGIFEFLAPGRLAPEMPAAQLAAAANDYILRRTKDAVLDDLPPKIIRDETLPLTPAQAASYEAAEKQGVIRLSEMGDELTIQHVFELVLRLKQICNFDPLTHSSSKLDRLEAELEEVAGSGKQAIVFSQWVSTLQRLAQRLAPYRPLQYHGRIPSRQRDSVIQQFREHKEHRVLLMSYGAGSVGLNLQFCSYVFLFDRWWNPAVEDQAINRAHRIGAAGTVTVTRMLSENTIEERINQVLEEKRELFRSLLDGADPPRASLTQEEIFGLFQLPCPRRANEAA